VTKVSKIILGIDPGTLAMGFAIIKSNGRNVELLEMDVLKLSSYKDMHQRLLLIHQKIEGLIQTWRPQSFAIEAPFFGKNVQSMLKLGRAQGVAIASAMLHQLTVEEYSPKKVKQSVTGNGNASKEQVWQMLQQMLSLKEAAPYSFDATDALAVAVCHHLQSQNEQIRAQMQHQRQSEGTPLKATGAGGVKKKDNSWENFLKKNPDRRIKG